MKRTKDAAFLNEVANHPDVRPWLGLDGKSEIDLTGLLDQPGNFALVNDHGGFVFMHEGGGVYELHTQFLPSGRGRLAVSAALEIEFLMFTLYGATLLKTYVPHENRGALGLVRLAGFERTHEDSNSSYWALSKADWEARQAARGLTMSAAV